MLLGMACNDKNREVQPSSFAHAAAELTLTVALRTLMLVALIAIVFNSVLAEGRAFLNSVRLEFGALVEFIHYFPS